MNRSDVRVGVVYAFGGKRVPCSPALVVDTRLWTLDPRCGERRISLAPPGHRGMRVRVPGVSATVPEVHVDTGVLVIRDPDARSDPQQTLEVLSSWSQRVSRLGVKEGRLEGLSQQLRNEDLLLSVAILRELVGPWEEYARRRSARSTPSRAQRDKVLAEARWRDERLQWAAKVLERRGLGSTMTVTRRKSLEDCPLTLPERVSLPLGDLLRLLEELEENRPQRGGER